MSKQIDPSRQTMYYLGKGLMVVGFLSFMSCFLSGIMAMAHPPDFGHAGAYGASLGIRAFGGMFLMIVGGFVSQIGRAGLAGSGVVLDPEQAREDLEPFSRQAGGMVKDALDEADIHLGGQAVREVVKVRCRACSHLNNEDAKFCQECGARM